MNEESLYSSYNLDHLGLVAGMVDELGLPELIDAVIIQDHEQRVVSVGQCVKAMVLNPTFRTPAIQNQHIRLPGVGLY